MTRLPLASEQQVAGSHYKDFKIQPAEFIHKNGLSFLVGNIIKYACRYKMKGGQEDLLKIKHYADLILEHEYGVDAGGTKIVAGVCTGNANCSQLR